MKKRSMQSVFWGTLAPLLAVTFSRQSLAAPQVAPGSPTAEPPAETTKAPAREVVPTATAEPPDVARLPPSAFPAPRVRGIYGGSLWMTFHGLQWPYSPLVSDNPRTHVGLSGSVWVDTGYEKINRGDPNETATKYWLQQGRFVGRLTPTYTDGTWFVQGQAELVANKDQTLSQPDVVDTDDLWIKAGRWNMFDVQVGRYEAWELYHFGMGLDLNTLERQGAVDLNLSVPSIYGVTYAFYRPSGVGNLGIHLYPTDFLRFELLGQVGNESGQNALAARPAVILDFGWLKLKGGAEYKHLTAQNEGIKEDRKSRGGGGAVQFVIDPYVEFGFNAAYGLSDHIDVNGGVDQPGSVTTYSYGGFANARIVGDLLAGAGYDYTWLENIHRDPDGRVGTFSHTQTFGALQYLLFKQLYIKAVVAYAKAGFNPTFTMSPAFHNTMTSARLRLMYTF